MTRLFVGLWLSAAMQQEVTEWMRNSGRQSSGFKWTPSENLHFTLKFFGDVPAGEIDRLIHVLRESAYGQKMFRLKLGSMGAFPDRSNPRIIWVGISQGEEQLRTLADAVEEYSVQAGFAANRQPFQPHLTVARMVAAGGTLPDFGSKTMFESETEVGSISLIESTLRSSGALYRSIADFRLEPAVADG